MFEDLKRTNKIISQENHIYDWLFIYLFYFEKVSSYLIRYLGMTDHLRIHFWIEVWAGLADKCSAKP